MEDPDCYFVFVRNWWRVENGRKVPNSGGRKTTLYRNLTFSEAQSMCREYNATHEPGPLSRKAEFDIQR